MEDEKPSHKPRWLNVARSTVVASIVSAFAAILVALIGLYASSRNTSSPMPAAVSPKPSHSDASANPGPQAVLDAYLTAVNDRAWPEVWRLGERNLGPTYGAMVAGFRFTKRDTLLSFESNGSHVAAQIAAVETNGAIQ